MRDLQKVVSAYESVASHAFQPAHFNYVASMQNDPSVHFHAIPRYSTPVRFGGVYWHDDDWPFFLDFPRSSQDTAPHMLNTVTTKLRESAKAKRYRR
ncbi:hypothetical protein GORBP_081_01130 [Gordonia rubripertincta NBRC 101908]|uniref:HIT domain-containing protein n=1 Tax=Gordonia rubripertincta NBRC 101908 TaxID=1077975 RepID=A0ABQ0HX21_GORRU|nr:hypothetical protein GORBP_081_01130 [Gordonia rubripertincta NBRC 101908]